MTDNEIIKAIEGCIAVDVSCGNCPFDGYHDCDKRMREMFLDLIERQKVEVEGYKESNREYAEMLAEQEVQIKMLQKENEAFAPLGKLYSEIKADAYKEFADALKNCFCISKEYLDVMTLIDNTLREITGKGGNE